MTVDSIVDGLSSYLQSNGNADYITLIEGIGIVGKIASIILGLLVTIILIGLPLVISIEVCYINFPIFRERFDDLYNRLNGKRQVVLGLVVRDAKKAVVESHTTQYGIQVNNIYLKMKCKAVFICIFLVALVLGPGQFLIGFAYNLVQGVVSAIF